MPKSAVEKHNHYCPLVMKGYTRKELVSLWYMISIAVKPTNLSWLVLTLGGVGDSGLWEGWVIQGYGRGGWFSVMGGVGDLVLWEGWVIQGCGRGGWFRVMGGVGDSVLLWWEWWMIQSNDGRGGWFSLMMGGVGDSVLLWSEEWVIVTRRVNHALLPFILLLRLLFPVPGLQMCCSQKCTSLRGIMILNYY